MNSFEALVKVLPPSPASGLELDWAAVEEEQGLKFPSDYKNLIACYEDVLFG
ncbi:hypothetical protein AB0G51_19820 [Streptomyces asoensis]|uniref:hypothetical protein n=1 Tax=Streptomyces asoensis TaxID=249586 RepID=UPI0033F824B7